MNRRGTLAALKREAERLVAPHASLGIPIPAYGGRSLPNLASSLFAAVTGRTTASFPGVLPPLSPEVDPFDGRRAPGRVVHLLLDGLGWEPFLRWSATTGRLGRAWRGRSRPITTVFPSTTTAALTSASTGAAPSSHGLVGYRQYLPRFGVVADLLRMSPVNVAGLDLLVQREWKPEFVSGVPTLFRRGLVGSALSRDRFEGTGFTRVLYEGSTYVPYATAADLAHELTRLLNRRSPAGALYVYWDELDTIQHLRGPERASLFDLEMSHIVHLLGYVARHVGANVARRTTMLITGDHGQVPAALDRQIRVDRVRGVAKEMARPLAGDRRAGFFAARPGRREALRGALNEMAPRGSRIVAMEDAVAAGLFGPPPYHPELSDRLGDFLVLVPPPWGLTYLTPGTPSARRHLYGAHGGADPAELLVPLIAGGLRDLTGGDPAGRP